MSFSRPTDRLSGHIPFMQGFFRKTENYYGVPTAPLMPTNTRDWNFATFSVWLHGKEHRVEFNVRSESKWKSYLELTPEKKLEI